MNRRHWFDPFPDRNRIDMHARNAYSNKALSPYLPPRPKKPDSAFAIFMKDLSAQFHQNRTPAANTRFVNVARARWTALTPEQKQEYIARALAERGNKQRALELWYKMKNMLRRPPNPYCLFTKQAWANRDPNDRSSILQFSTLQSRTWREMDAIARAPYVRQAAELLARHRLMHQTLRIGGDIIPFLEGGEAYVREQGQGQQQANPIADAVGGAGVHGQGAPGRMHHAPGHGGQGFDQEDADDDDQGFPDDDDQGFPDDDDN